MSDAARRLRWPTIEQEAEGRLPGTAPAEVVTHPEFAGIEFLHVRAKSLINHVPAAAGMPFEHTINVYRGCSHACSYCLEGETPILMADGRTKPLADLRIGDEIYGTLRRGAYRRYTTTKVLDHWCTPRRAYRITLADGTTVVASADHRFLARQRGWKYVTGAEQGAARRPHLTTNDSLLGTGRFTEPPKGGRGYRLGYLTGMIRGDANPGVYPTRRADGSYYDAYRFRLALADGDALMRSRRYLLDEGVATDEFDFSRPTASHRAMRAIRTSRRASIEAITALIAWPSSPSAEWCKGFLAGIFDAEGSYSRGVLRISNNDEEIIQVTAACLRRFGFTAVIERADDRCNAVRIARGLRAHLRFFHTVEPAITRKLSIDGVALESDSDLRVVGIEPLDVVIPMYDITTGTGDFIANGVVSHNCFARPSHTYLDLDAGRDFESKIVVKINAVERLRAELRRPSWGGHHIAMGTNTDPYQRCEGRYRLTRGVIEALTRAGNPFSVLTKSPLVLRDLDLLAEANRRMHVPVSLSIPTLDEQVWHTSEPGTPHPRRRLEAVAALSAAGVPSGVMVAPVLPGISDSYRQLEEVVAGALEAGATSVTPVTLHLRPGVREVFMGWLAETHPRLVPTYERLYQRAYAPPEVRRRISRRVHHLVERHGGPRPHAERERSGWRADAPPTGVAGAADPDRGQQLSLRL